MTKLSIGTFKPALATQKVVGAGKRRPAPKASTAVVSRVKSTQHIGRNGGRPPGL